MDDRNTLLEQREEALFALLMERGALEESARLERLNQELAETQPPSEQSVRRCLRRIRRAFARRSLRRRSRRLLPPLLSVLFVAAIAFSAAFWLFPAFHTAVLNLRVDSDPQAPQRGASDADAYLANADLPFTLEIPEGFAIISSIVNTSVEDLAFQSNLNPDVRFTFTAWFSEDIVMSYNTEGYLTRETVDVNGHDADFFVNETQNWIAWTDTDVPYVVFLESVNLPPDDFLAIARSVAYVGT